MTERITGLAEVTLALAIATAQRDRRLLQPFSDQLRLALIRHRHNRDAFEEAFQFAARWDSAFDGYSATGREL